MKELSTSALVWALTEPATPASREAVVAELVARIRIGAHLAGVLNLVAWASEAEPEAAALLQGAARRLAVVDSPELGAPQAPPGTGTGMTDGTAGLVSALRREATDRIANSIGVARQRELRSEGAAMDTDGAVRFALALIDRILGPSFAGTADPGRT